MDYISLYVGKIIIYINYYHLTVYVSPARHFDVAFGTVLVNSIQDIYILIKP